MSWPTTLKVSFTGRPVGVVLKVRVLERTSRPSGEQEDARESSACTFASSREESEVVRTAASVVGEQ